MRRVDIVALPKEPWIEVYELPVSLRERLLPCEDDGGDLVDAGNCEKCPVANVNIKTLNIPC